MYGTDKQDSHYNPEGGPATPGCFYGPCYPGYGYGPGCGYGPGYGNYPGCGPGCGYGPGCCPGYGNYPGYGYGPGYCPCKEDETNEVNQFGFGGFGYGGSGYGSRRGFSTFFLIILVFLLFPSFFGGCCY
ncbi:MAG: hypothetical protein PHD60_12035 [Clostridia bacterium]|nr:hypothetical protein [Clostridia bacterium]